MGSIPRDLSAYTGYNASNIRNKKQYIKQMTIWLRRQEAIHRFCLYLQWAVPGYTADILATGEQEDDAGEDDEAEDEGLREVLYLGSMGPSSSVLSWKICILFIEYERAWKTATI
ncbi:hypothetical protein BYT27DRAFT_7194511 [Phlegmacium glaucopus]|nr:hypothetical protein BYT27DRAFT_7194511 [Phlegmacium glaucopus]